MIDREHDLSITKQAEVLQISRGSVYYPAAPGVGRRSRGHAASRSAASGVSFRRFADVERPAAAEGCKIGRRHVKTLMRRMGIEALYRRPRTTKPEPGHKIYPYLLRGMEITRPNQVWAMDITYIPMARGFVYLAVVLDWATRRVLSWRLSITMEAAFCVETLEDALALHGRPDVFNTDQGSQFTGADFTAVLAAQRHRHQHGRQRGLAGQRVRRAAVAQRQVRGGVSAGLRDRQRGARLDRQISRLLQSPPSPLEP
ncbi:putative transposase [Bradyrhizobium sp. LB13.1]